VEDFGDVCCGEEIWGGGALRRPVGRLQEKILVFAARGVFWCFYVTNPASKKLRRGTRCWIISAWDFFRLRFHLLAAAEGASSDGLNVPTLRTPPCKNLRVGHPPRFFGLCAWEIFDAAAIVFGARPEVLRGYGLGVSTLRTPPCKNLRVGHPPRFFGLCAWEILT
jgi:hypothetical protein